MRRWNTNAQFRFFNHYKKGVSTVVSGAILLVGISLIGVIGVSWAKDNLNNNEKLLDNTYSTNINKIKEAIVPQHEWYNTAQKQLNITFINTGIDGLNVNEIEIKGIHSIDLRILPTSVPPGKTFSKLVSYNWAGDPIDISLVSTRGSIFTHHLGTPADGQLIIKKLARQADGNFSYYGDLGTFSVSTSGNTNTVNLDKNGNMVLSGTIHDFNGSAAPHYADPDFEKVCGYCPFGVIPGIVMPTLGSDSTPVYNNQTTSAFNNGYRWFNQWFHDNSTINAHKQLNITLIEQGTTPQTWKYSNMSFFPIDNQLFGNSGQDAQGKWHNFGFTYEVHSSFTYQGGETFNFWGDDDVWVFINKKLALDLGGVHAGAPGTINLDAQASTLGITRGNVYPFDFFYAERHTTSSEIQITTSIQLGNPGSGQSGIFFVDPGIYTVGETPAPGWTLQSVTCDNTYSQPNATKVTVTVPKGVTTCTFTNFHN
ncbi:MAG: fibro-slime domain-containing protein [Candidatus Nitrosotalea sp.]|nr:fibro-slime domain-containing protein [Candidatus Nitrosotalea sp.]